MKAYKVELLIIDHDELGSEGIKEMIEYVRYPNHCLSPEVMKVESSEIGEWSDDHPFNFKKTTKREYLRHFPNEAIDLLIKSEPYVSDVSRCNGSFHQPFAKKVHDEMMSYFRRTGRI